jgi:putative transposase
MPRANRYHIPGYIWHLTHRCHKKEFLLKFSKDRRRWMAWLFQAKKRYGLKILNFVATRNHIHLLVADGDKPHVIPKSLQLIAGRTAQEFNIRKRRNGAFWEDRYHATAIENGIHLINCLIYIDLNMVRAGVVKHPIQWAHGGFYEMERAPHRKDLVDYGRLLKYLEIRTIAELRVLRRRWITEKMTAKEMARESHWTESVAVGSREFLNEMKERQGIRTWRRAIEPIDADSYQLKERRGTYYIFRVNRPY